MKFRTIFLLILIVSLSSCTTTENNYNVEINADEILSAEQILEENHKDRVRDYFLGSAFIISGVFYVVGSLLLFPYY